MFKDKDKQREANRQASKKYRDSMTVADERPDEPSNVIPKSDIRVIPKRGKDIKTFADLPPDVQETIYKSCPDIVKDYDERCRRTAIAINYQHLFPDRYHSTGCDVFKRKARG